LGLPRKSAPDLLRARETPKLDAGQLRTQRPHAILKRDVIAELAKHIDVGNYAEFGHLFLEPALTENLRTKSKWKVAVQTSCSKRPDTVGKSDVITELTKLIMIILKIILPLLLPKVMVLLLLLSQVEPFVLLPVAAEPKVILLVFVQVSPKVRVVES